MEGSRKAMLIQVFDRHSIDSEDQARNHHVVAEELSNSSLFGLRGTVKGWGLQIGSFYVDQRYEQRLVLGYGAGPLDRAKGPSDEPHVSTLTCAYIEVRAVNRRMTLEWEFQ